MTTPTALGGITIRKTGTLLSPLTRICGLVFSPPKLGKTTFAATLDDFTKKYRGKPTLFIACESAEGGGTMSIAEKDIDYVTPKDWTEMESIIGNLATNSHYGGVVLDNSTDYITRIVKPHALKFPPKERDLGARSEGVPVRSDYQVMGECARQQLNRLINLTNGNTDERFRKDLIVTALEREKTDDNGSVTAILPELPGALASAVPAMFQSVMSVLVKNKVVPKPGGKPGETIKVPIRILHVKANGLRITDDRTGIFQHEFPLTDDRGLPQGICEMYAEWVKRFDK